MPPPACWSELADGLRVAVKVTPRARAAGIGGVAASADGPRLRIAVTAAPEAGRASAAAAAALARALGIARSQVSLHAGAASREKIFHIHGPAAELAARLQHLLLEPSA